VSASIRKANGSCTSARTTARSWGCTDLSLTAKLGEVVRFYLTNTANARVFRVALPGARMKLVGGDSGRVEHEQLVDDVLLAPSERVVVDMLFDRPGELTLEHRTPELVYPLASIQVSEEPTEPYGHGRSGGRRAGPLRLPDAPDVVSEEPGHCPDCGMKLLPAPLTSPSTTRAA
jgi:hypothetical protein